jgi:hypothetical protein
VNPPVACGYVAHFSFRMVGEEIDDVHFARGVQFNGAGGVGEDVEHAQHISNFCKSESCSGSVMETGSCLNPPFRRTSVLS